MDKDHDENKRIDELVSAIRPFVYRNGGTEESAIEIARNIWSVLGEHAFEWEHWWLGAKKIRYSYSEESHSFFDDGGGIVECRLWSLEAIKETGEQHRNKSASDEAVAAGIINNPFGLKGLFNFQYENARYNTD